MAESLPSWKVIESELALRPKGVSVRLALRAAARLAPVIAEGTAEYGPESLEWFHATYAVVNAVEAYSRGERVSRFTLDIAAELVRGAANAAVGTIRLLGHSKAAEDTELAFAAAAFAADAARLSAAPRIAAAAMQALRVAHASGRIPEQLLAADYAGADGPLWPDGEPAWSSEGHAKLAAAIGLPVILGLGGSIAQFS